MQGSLPNYIDFVRNIGIEPPYTLEAGVVGIKNAYLGVPRDYDDGLRGPIHTNELVCRRTLNDASETSIQEFLLGFFEELFDIAGYNRPENFKGFPK